MTHDPACDLATGSAAPGDAAPPGTLVAVFASPVAEHLVHFAQHLGWRCVLVEPVPDRVDQRLRDACDRVDDSVGQALEALEAPETPKTPADGDGAAADQPDVVVTDHDRPELGPVLRDALTGPARWVGVMGSPRHAAPHVPALRSLGVPDDVIARVHRPIGLDIGSRTPAEIALSTLAGLLADRRGRTGRAGPAR